VDLHRRSFGSGRPPHELEEFLAEIFFGHPWVHESFPSLGCFQPDGTLIGCLGVMPRPMVLDEMPLRAAVSHNFMVDAAHRGGLTAIRLEKAVVEQGAELVMSEGNESARRICEALGGHVLRCRSERWVRILRPAALAVHLRTPPTVARRLAPATAVVDDCLSAVGVPRRPSLDAPGRALDVTTWLQLVERETRAAALRPVYTQDSLSWLLGTLAKSRRDQRLRAVAVMEGEVPIGWYVYYSRPGGVGRVLQLGGVQGSALRVLEHLFADAEAGGNVAVTGQVDPAWSEAVAASGCLVRPGKSWFLAYATRPGIRHLVDTSRAFLSRLEGEGWLRFAF
jgi:hypothetical protein